MDRLKSLLKEPSRCAENVQWRHSPVVHVFDRFLSRFSMTDQISYCSWILRDFFGANVVLKGIQKNSESVEEMDGSEVRKIFFFCRCALFFHGK